MNNLNILIEWTIFSARSCSLKFIIILDWISLRFRLIVCLISACVMCFSSRYIRADPFLSRFSILVMLFVLSMNLLIFIPSLPALLIGWDGLGIVSFALVIYYQNPKSLGAGILTILANRIGDVIILIGIALLLLEGHWFVTCLWDFKYLYIVAGIILVAGITKSAQIPFCSWLPAAIAAPTPVSALVHSSTLVTAGVFILVRLYPTLSKFSTVMIFLLVIAISTLFLAGIGANYENDLKKIIALSTLRQLGIIILSLGIGQPVLTMFHLFSHALFKALLFICAGVIIHRSLNNQDIRRIGLIFINLPGTVACFNVANLSLCGFPFLAGFYSKDAILEYCLRRNVNLFLTFMIFLATGLTSAYSVRLSFCTLWGKPKVNRLTNVTDKDYFVLFSIIILTSMAISAGISLQVLTPRFENTLFVLSPLQKRLTIFVVSIGVLVSLGVWKFVSHFGQLRWIFSSLFFLFYLSTTPFVKRTVTRGLNIIKSVDGGWLEILGGQGSLATFTKLTSVNQLIQIFMFTFTSLLAVLIYVGVSFN